MQKITSNIQRLAAILRDGSVVMVTVVLSQRLRVCTESQHRPVLSQSPLSSQSLHGFSVEMLTHACAVYNNASLGIVSKIYRAVDPDLMFCFNDRL